MILDQVGDTGRVKNHPAILLPVFRRYLIQLWAIAILQMVWAGLAMYIAIHPPHLLRTLPPAYYPVLFLYGFYSSVHAIYILIANVMSFFLLNRTWLRAAALACMIPGPGFLFGLFHCIPAWRIYCELKNDHWKAFFAWRSRTHPVNPLTEDRPD